MSKKFFILKNIDPLRIESKFCISLTPNGGLQTSRSGISSLTPSNVTLLSTRSGLGGLSSVASFGPSVLSMNLQTCSSISHTRCFWCRNYFQNQPVKLPVRFIPPSKAKQLSFKKKEDSYTIRTNISRMEATAGNVDLLPSEAYECDGYFCSYNCCLAFYTNHAHDPQYRHSYQLLYDLWRQTNPEGNTDTFRCAPSWRLLNDYGGNMTIEQFRNVYCASRPELQPSSSVPLLLSNVHYAGIKSG